MWVSPKCLDFAWKSMLEVHSGWNSPTSLTTLRKSRSLPPFTRASLNFATVTFGQLGRNHIAPKHPEAIPMLSLN